MRQDFIEDDEEIERGPSKSQLKREQLELQELGRETVSYTHLTLPTTNEV